MPTSHRYLVTGGAGFIGSALVSELLRRHPGADVTVLDDCSSGSFANLVEACARAEVGPFRGRFIPAGLAELDFDDLLDALQPDAVFHLAAVTDTTLADERRMIEDNASTFPPILHACADTRTPLVYASSAATYGTPTRAAGRAPFPEDAAGEPNNVYGFSKWLMETEHRRFVAQAGDDERDAPRRAHIVGLRYFNVFGPGEARKGPMASMPYQLTQQILAGGRPRLFTPGDQARDQIHVDDVVAGTLAAAGLGKRPTVEPGIYNLGSGRATTFNQIADAIRDALGIPHGNRPTAYFDMPRDIRAFYQDYTCADMSAAQRALGFTPAIDPLDGITSYALHLKARHNARAAPTPPTHRAPAEARA